MFGYIYKTTNLLNNKIYIGQHKSELFDTKYFGSGKILKNAINKYGIENFRCEILQECANQQDLDKAEIYWIDKFNSTNSAIGYNICSGGNGTSGYIFTDEVKKKIGEKSREHNLNRDPSIYKKSSETSKGNRMMNKDGKCIRVHEKDFEEYTQNGWQFGGLSRKGKYKNRHQKKHKNCTTKNKIAINKNKKITFIDKQFLSDYLIDGWRLGFK